MTGGAEASYWDTLARWDQRGVKSTVSSVFAEQLPSNEEVERVELAEVDFAAESRSKWDLGQSKNFVSHPIFWFLKTKRGVRHY